MFAPPLTARTPLDGAAGGPPLSRMGSNDSFVCNVSDDEVPERDVDMEIEARIRSGTLDHHHHHQQQQPSASSSSSPPPSTSIEHQQQQWLQRDRAVSIRAMQQRPGPTTLSQRMLSKLQRNKKQAAVRDTRSKRIGSTALEVVHAERVLDDNTNHHSMAADYDGLVVADPLYDPSQDPVYMSSDDETTTISHSISTSCADRLEARISERRLQNKSSLSARPDSMSGAAVDGNELSVMYTNRRTYPAEAAKKPVDNRFSVDGGATTSNINTMAATEDRRQRLSQEQRSALAGIHVPSRSIPQDPTVDNALDASKSLPVAFHFQSHGNSTPQPPPSQYNRAVREAPRRGDPYSSLFVSIDQIEQVVNGLESCLSAGSSVASLAAVALRELELLRDSTKQVRTNGTTLILAEIGRPQSQSLGPLRQLVARAAQVQSRIDGLIAHVKRML